MVLLIGRQDVLPHIIKFHAINSSFVGEVDGMAEKTGEVELFF